MQFEETYIKLRTLGKGSFGQVKLVKRSTDDSLFVIKKIELQSLAEERREAIMLEVKLLSKLVHPNVIAYHGCFHQRKYLHIIMEYADGGTLGDLVQLKLKQKQLFSEVQIFQWCAQLVLALTYIHSQRVVHGDLKLHNVFLTSDKIKSGVGILKVGDFGLSRTLESIGSDNKKRFAGTPHYASPEVCNGQGSSKRSDMWSLGCVMYELVTLKKPFMARSVPAVMKKIIQADFIPVIEEEAQRAKYEKIEDMDRIIKSLLVLEAERRKSANSLKGDPLLKYHIQTFREDLDKRAGSLVLTTSGMFQTGKAQIKSEANAYASTASIVSEDSEEAKLGEDSGESSMASDMGDDNTLMDEVELAKMEHAGRTFEGAGNSFDNNSLPSVEDGLGFSMDEAKFMDDIARSPRKKSSQRKQAKGDTGSGESSGSEKTGGEGEGGTTGAGSSRTATAATATKAGAATSATAAQDSATTATPTANGKDGKVRRGSNSPKADAFLSLLKKRKGSRLSERRGSTGDIKKPNSERGNVTKPESLRGATKLSPRNQPLDLKPIHISSGDAQSGRKGSVSVVVQPNRFRYVSNASMATSGGKQLRRRRNSFTNFSGSLIASGSFLEKMSRKKKERESMKQQIKKEFETWKKYRKLLEEARNKGALGNSTDMDIFSCLRGVLGQQPRSSQNTFTGSQIVDFIAFHKESGSRTRVEAVSMVQEMKAKGLLFDGGSGQMQYNSVTEAVFRDDSTLYSFAPTGSRWTLNTAVNWSFPARPAGEVIRALFHEVMCMYSLAVTSDGTPDYVALAKSDAFAMFQFNCCELQNVKLDSQLRGDSLAFFINVYNVLSTHALILSRGGSAWKEENTQESIVRLRKANYLIDGVRFSLTEIKHGILRRNNLGHEDSGILEMCCFPLFCDRRPFKDSDQRRMHCATVLDPRIHFSLLGSADSPRVHFGVNLDESLQWAAEEFCALYVKIVEEDGDVTVYLPEMPFEVYGSDFGDSDWDRIAWIAQFLKTKERKKALNLIQGRHSDVEYYNHANKRSIPGVEHGKSKKLTMEQRYGNGLREWKRRGSFQHMLDMQLVEMRSQGSARSGGGAEVLDVGEVDIKVDVDNEGRLRKAKSAPPSMRQG